MNTKKGEARNAEYYEARAEEKRVEARNLEKQRCSSVFKCDEEEEEEKAEDKQAAENHAVQYERIARLLHEIEEREQKEGRDVTAPASRSVQAVLIDIREDIFLYDDSLHGFIRREREMEEVLCYIENMAGIVNSSARVNKRQESFLRRNMDTALWWRERGWISTLTMLNSFSG